MHRVGLIEALFRDASVSGVLRSIVKSLGNEMRDQLLLRECFWQASRTVASRPIGDLSPAPQLHNVAVCTHVPDTAQE